MKLTLKHLNEFKEEFEKWQMEFGLLEYRPTFKLCDLPEAYAEIEINEEGKVCTVSLGSFVGKNDIDGRDIGKSAKHECIHLLLYRLVWLSQKRHIREGEVEDEGEKVTRVLERIL